MPYNLKGDGGYDEDSKLHRKFKYSAAPKNARSRGDGSGHKPVWTLRIQSNGFAYPIRLLAGLFIELGVEGRGHEQKKCLVHG